MPFSKTRPRGDCDSWGERRTASLPLRGECTSTSHDEFGWTPNSHHRQKSVRPKGAARALLGAPGTAHPKLLTSADIIACMELDRWIGSKRAAVGLLTTCQSLC